MGFVRQLLAIASVCGAVLAGSSAIAQAPATTPAQLWADFNHYVLIARPDLAAASGQALINQVFDDHLLDIVEASDYSNPQQTFDRAARMPAVAEIAAALGQSIQNARFARAREPQRIRDDIQKLAGARRESQSATQRLREAGQYAAPLLLETLVDDRQARLHPYLIPAIIAVGRPVVLPLAVALEDLPPDAQVKVAQVLGEIGYPGALPYLKQVIEDRETTDATRRSLEEAFRRVAANATGPVTLQSSAAGLFLALGESFYRQATLDPKQLVGFDPASNQGLVWRYDPQTGLAATRVPAEVYGDVMAMRAAARALAIDPQLDPALSLLLVANERRENRLPEDAQDPSYTLPHPPAFYTLAAGPLRQHDGLTRALDDGDVDLALDFIRALEATAGTEALVNTAGTAQPLLRALTFPDRRVRFGAAFALANARPREAFPLSQGVVPVLAEAARQSDARYAVVVASERERANQLQAVVASQGFTVYSGTTLGDVADSINLSPGVDLIVIDQPLARAEDLYHQASLNYKLAAVPVVIVTRAGEQSAAEARFENVERVYLSAGDEGFSSAMEQVAAASGAISPEDADDFAVTAVDLLRQLAAESSAVYNVIDAQPALIAALDDPRDDVKLLAADALALFGTPESQRALAQAALDGQRPEEHRLEFMADLARSATLHGNKLTDLQLEKILALVQGEGDEMGQAAARVHGALTLPTRNVVRLLTE